MPDVARRFSVLALSAATLAAGSASPAAAAERAPRLAFVTSVAGNGDLSQWQPWAGANTGLAAADAICQSLATTAGLPEPTTFVAWLSDDSDDAYCRLHNLGGGRFSNCGQPSLPAAAGPWVRTDGFPFAERIELMATNSGVMYAPLWLDENGDRVSWTHAFTETEPNGAQDEGMSSCEDWTSPHLGLVTAGALDATTQSWTDTGEISCGQDAPLYCLQTGVGTDLPDVAGIGALAFVTSAFGTGNLAGWPSAKAPPPGAAAGDTICETLAEAARLSSPWEFKAWLSDSLDDAVDRMTYDGPWIRLDGVVVAESKADLVDGELLAPINVTEAGAYRGNYWVWTGTDEVGLGTGQHCLDWGSASDQVVASVGRANSAGDDWSDFFRDQGCDQLFGLLCLSQVSILIFEDGFESGSVEAWSNAATF